MNEWFVGTLTIAGSSLNHGGRQRFVKIKLRRVKGSCRHEAGQGGNTLQIKYLLIFRLFESRTQEYLYTNK